METRKTKKKKKIAQLDIHSEADVIVVVEAGYGNSNTTEDVSSLLMLTLVGGKEGCKEKIKVRLKGKKKRKEELAFF